MVKKPSQATVPLSPSFLQMELLYSHGHRLYVQKESRTVGAFTPEDSFHSPDEVCGASFFPPNNSIFVASKKLHCRVSQNKIIF